MSRKSKNKSGGTAIAAVADDTGDHVIATESTAVSHDLPRDARPWWRDWLITFLFFTAILLAYSHALHGAFVWDDDAYISKNPAMRDLHGLDQIWFHPEGAGHQYYPLSFTIFWIGFHIWGLNTLGYHLVNVVLHTATSVLLWQILKKLNVRGALLAGALFALHPVNVMSVAWMNEMKNTLSGSLALGAIWAYLRFGGLGIYARKEGRNENEARPWRWYALAAGLFILAMLAKTAVSFLPVSLLLIIWWQRERLVWRDLWPLLPLVGIIAGMGLFTIYIEQKVAGAEGVDFKLSFLGRLIVSGHSFFFYLWKLVLPVNLTFIYTRWEIHEWNPLQYFYTLAMVAVFVLLWRKRKVIGKGLFAATVHFYISTSFLIFMVVLYRMRYSFVADHWQYFGSMSVFAVMGAGLAALGDLLGGWKNALPRSLAATLFILLGALTWYQCGMFKDYEALWRWSIARNPECWMAENNLGNLLLDAGRIDESMIHLQRAIAIKPQYVLAMNNYGNALIKNNRVEDALNEFKQALAIKPDNAETLNNLGYAYQQKARVAEAVNYYQQALDIQPDDAMILNNYANALLQEGRTLEAIRQYQKALKFVPDYSAALNNLAYLLATSRDPAFRNGVKAVQLAKKAALLDPGNPVPLDTLAAALAAEGQFPQAVNVDWKAISEALAQKNTREANLFQKHINLYQAKQPLRDK